MYNGLNWATGSRALLVVARRREISIAVCRAVEWIGCWAPRLKGSGSAALRSHQNTIENERTPFSLLPGDGKEREKRWLSGIRGLQRRFDIKYVDQVRRGEIPEIIIRSRMFLSNSSNKFGKR